jgi:hypothetical protein
MYFLFCDWDLGVGFISADSEGCLDLVEWRPRKNKIILKSNPDQDHIFPLKLSFPKVNSTTITSSSFQWYNHQRKRMSGVVENLKFAARALTNGRGEMFKYSPLYPCHSRMHGNFSNKWQLVLVDQNGIHCQRHYLGLFQPFYFRGEGALCRRIHLSARLLAPFKSPNHIYLEESPGWLCQVAHVCFKRCWHYSKSCWLMFGDGSSRKWAIGRTLTKKSLGRLDGQRSRAKRREVKVTETVIIVIEFVWRRDHDRGRRVRLDEPPDDKWFEPFDINS